MGLERPKFILMAHEVFEFDEFLIGQRTVRGDMQNDRKTLLGNDLRQGGPVTHPPFDGSASVALRNLEQPEVSGQIRISGALEILSHPNVGHELFARIDRELGRIDPKLVAKGCACAKCAKDECQ